MRGLPSGEKKIRNACITRKRIAMSYRVKGRPKPAPPIGERRPTDEVNRLGQHSPARSRPVNDHTVPQELDFQRVTAGVFDRLSGLATWADILEPAGWTRARPPDTQTVEAWKRPGKTEYPVSAKVLTSNPIRACELQRELRPAHWWRPQAHQGPCPGPPALCRRRAFSG
jgi:hypothetical protein